MINYIIVVLKFKLKCYNIIDLIILFIFFIYNFFYMNSSIYKTMDSVENYHWWFVSRAKIVETMIRKYFPFKSDLSILDIGCGSGGNFKMLSIFGKITGLEPDEFAATQAKNKNIANKVIQDDFIKNLEVQNQKYDLIVLTDVLEHIEKDKEALNKIINLLQPDGKLLITVPAGMNIWSNHDITHQHFRRYSKNELKEKLLTAGFQINKLSYYNFFLYPLVFIERKLKLNKNEDDVDMSGGILNSVLKVIFSSEAFWLKLGVNFPIGVSLITVCSKK